MHTSHEVVGDNAQAVVVCRCRACGNLRSVLMLRETFQAFQAEGKLVWRWCMKCSTTTYHEPTTMSIEEMEA